MQLKAAPPALLMKKILFSVMNVKKTYLLLIMVLAVLRAKKMNSFTTMFV